MKPDVREVRDAECGMRYGLRQVNRAFLLMAVGALAYPSLSVALSDELFLGRSLDEWNEVLTSSEGSRRVYAAWGISRLASRMAGGLGDQIAFSELVKLVSDSDPAVRCWGISGLTEFAQRLGPKDGGKTAVINTLGPLLGDAAASPRIGAAESLGLLGQPENALPVLVAAIGDRQEAVRLQAVSALEKLGNAARPAEQALRNATNDPSEAVKTIAKRALGRLESKKK